MSIRNSITLNGNSSEDIEGLIIQELPPITKPAIRTEVETIDGRDGDIVTKLGYAAYDKEITIGLYGDYDIDDIISFFDSEGVVIFSNEEEKCYNYQIVNQIDFERLVRFRTATVKFHVQPFKYSTDEKAKTFSTGDWTNTDNYGSNLLTIPDFTQTTNGITLTVADGVISVSGTGTATTEFYLPIDALTLAAKKYIWTALGNDAASGACSLRLIGSAPSAADSFGGTFLTLIDNVEQSIEATLTDEKTFNYIWFYISANVALDFTMDTAVERVYGGGSVNVTNSGNIYSRPTITLVGEGTINLSLNGEQLFVIDLGDSTATVTIDTANMEAYYGTSGALANRAVDGDYDNFQLAVGKNTISWSGDLTQIVINNYSRWI